MTKRSVRIIAALIAGALFALAGCSGSGEGAPSDDAGAEASEVKIGFAAPLTGDNAIYGEGMKRAVEMAIAEANESDEARAAGVTFALSAQDDQSDPKQAVSVAKLLIGDPSVVAVVGHFNSGCTLPAAPEYAAAGLAHVTVSSNPAITAQDFSTVNRIVAKDDAQGGYAADLVLDELGIDTVVVVDDSTQYGQGLAAEFVKRFEAGGGTVLAAEKIQAKDVDFSAMVTKFKGLAPEAIYYGGAHTEGALLSKQAKEAGLKVPVIGGDMLFSADYMNVAGAANAEGDICTSLGLPLEQQPRGVEFAAAYEERYGAAPEAYDSYAYDSAWIIINAVLDAGADRDAVAQAIRALTFDGVTGEVSFDEAGDNRNQVISSYRVENGAWKQLID
ncbi:MAG: branched-chain amino acid ABC transporter substrate-binding protein [Coriobacteriia bacterium]|nr:branched-chain amino acid ABC transporter substrate-binding protein [Anaerosomatales bacterium]